MTKKRKALVAHKLKRVRQRPFNAELLALLDAEAVKEIRLFIAFQRWKSFCDGGAVTAAEARAGRRGVMTEEDYRDH
jgi:hypothetical protein